MDIMGQFMAYAADFEKTLVDDDWTRLRHYFADDAVYEVVDDRFGCRLRGPEAIFAGMRKSLNGFDRQFAKRDIEVTSGPEIADDSMTIGWKVVYSKDGVPPFTLPGRSTARYAGEKIVHLRDTFDPGVADDLAAWQAKTGQRLDPSYT